jgi:hypothetical protein
VGRAGFPGGIWSLGPGKVELKFLIKGGGIGIRSKTAAPGSGVTPRHWDLGVDGRLGLAGNLGRSMALQHGDCEVFVTLRIRVSVH